MQYTQDEIEAMKQAMKQIEEYIATEILPYTREYFHVGWGEKYVAPRGWHDWTWTHHIGVYPDLKVAAYGKQYGSNRTFIMPSGKFNMLKEAKKYPYFSDSFSQSIYDAPYAMHEIISNWKGIKKMLLDGSNEQLRKLRAIQEFQI